MISQQRLDRLEARIVLLEATLDGSESQTREATVHLVGLVTRFLHGKGLIDEKALRKYLTEFEGESEMSDNHMSQMVRQFSSMLDFHERYPVDFEPDLSDLIDV
jgi:hypothetical protein